MLGDVFLFVDGAPGRNTVTVTKDWGRESIVSSQHVPLSDFDVSTATLGSDGATASILASYAWSSPAEGVRKPVCHILARQYSLSLDSKIWEGELAASETTVDTECRPPVLESTTDGRGVIDTSDELWFSVATHRVHRVTKGRPSVAGPMIADVDGVEWGDHPAKMTVFDPITEASMSVVDAVLPNQDDPTPGELYRQLATHDQRTASWLDDHTVILGVANPSPNTKVPISAFDVRTGAYRVLFWVEGYGVNHEHSTAVDVQTGTVLVFNSSAFATDPLEAYSLNGKKLWTLEGASVCAIGGGHAVVVANGQVATLASSSGGQVSFSATEDCTGTVRGRYLLRPNATGISVVRILP